MESMRPGGGSRCVCLPASPPMDVGCRHLVRPSDNTRRMPSCFGFHWDSRHFMASVEQLEKHMEETNISIDMPLWILKEPASPTLQTLRLLVPVPSSFTLRGRRLFMFVRSTGPERCNWLPTSKPCRPRCTSGHPETASLWRSVVWGSPVRWPPGRQMGGGGAERNTKNT